MGKQCSRNLVVVETHLSSVCLSIWCRRARRGRRLYRRLCWEESRFGLGVRRPDGGCGVFIVGNVFGMLAIVSSAEVRRQNFLDGELEGDGWISASPCAPGGGGTTVHGLQVERHQPSASEESSAVLVRPSALFAGYLSTNCENNSFTKKKRTIPKHFPVEKTPNDNSADVVCCKGACCCCFYRVAFKSFPSGTSEGRKEANGGASYLPNRVGSSLRNTSNDCLCGGVVGGRCLASANRVSLTPPPTCRKTNGECPREVDPGCGLLLKCQRTRMGWSRFLALSKPRIFQSSF
ncbi:hypothetical protein CEXT_48481 [Caerostris extrusa]|uniref:Uncharacterized protein n=1 Tax=Caerostris extrusa TaxID=172846 RepID=A0AAV4N3V5_CAEEX|nr:hypothetical protein CEXT_48481 [Caerostris extrusa]